MVTTGYRLILLLLTTSGPSLPGIPFRLGITYHACMETPLPEVNPPGDLCPDLLGPTDAQCLCKIDVGKEKGSLGVPTPTENPPSFRSQYGCEAAPY